MTPSVRRVKLSLKTNSQLPNLSGQAWPSIGKFIRRMGHSAFIVNLSENTEELKGVFDLCLINCYWLRKNFWVKLDPVGVVPCCAAADVMMNQQTVPNIHADNRHVHFLQR